jgi:hypothetical protein
MVATSPALPPAPDASLALKHITQAGAGGSSAGVSMGSDGGGSEVMAASSGAARGGETRLSEAFGDLQRNVKKVA